MTARHTQRREFLLGALAGSVSVPAAAAQSGLPGPYSFWARLAGTWLGELTYLDGSLQPIIQSYHSVVELAFQDAQLSQTEHKFYPAGTQLARNIGGTDLPADQGVELISATSGAVVNDRWAPAGDGVYHLVDEATMLRHAIDGDTGVPRYVTYWTLTTPRTLLVTNLGILYTADAADYYNRPLEPRRPNTHLGELKGCSVFRYVRIDVERDEALGRLRRLHNVSRSVDRRRSAG
jgi:hypothetical protein